MSLPPPPQKSSPHTAHESHPPRYALLDGIRGITLCSMILYHAAWDAVYLLGADWPWYGGAAGFLWQQSICWTFILLSGFCVNFSRRLLRRGLLVSAAGALVTAATLVALPQDRVVFGVLTLLGACMVLAAAGRSVNRRLCRRGAGEKETAAGEKKQVLWIFALVMSAFLFFLFRGVNAGYAGFGALRLFSFPQGWYRGMAATFLGFTDPVFFSTDYFSLLPWLFLFLCGLFLGKLCLRGGALQNGIWKKRLPAFDWMGRHSLLLYLLHQPLLYLLVLLIQARR